MPRVLADGKTKFTILTAAPADPAAPTDTELNAGIDLSFKVLASDFNWTATDSETVSEAALGEDDTAEVLTRGNYNVGFSLWRYYLDGGGVDDTEDAGFAAVKEKGTTLWGYARRTDAPATQDWAADDEVYLGGEFIVDNLQAPESGGFIKVRVPGKMQRGYPYITVGTGV